MSNYHKVFRGAPIWIINLKDTAKFDESPELPSCFQNIDQRIETLLIYLGDLLNPSLSDGEGPEPYMEHIYRIISTIIETCKLHNDIDSLSIVVEDSYVDRVYRDTYYMHYSGKHFDADRKAIRLFFFSDDIKSKVDSTDTCNRKYIERTLQRSFLGSLVLTSVHGCTVSRSLLSPTLFVNPFDRALIRVCNYICCMFGFYLNVMAFPYMQQDGETLSCAEVTILLLTDYYSQKYPDYRFILPSHIVRIGNPYTPQRMTPSIGMKYEGISHVLKDIGFEPLLIDAHGPVDIHFLIHSYVDSNIPIAIHLQKKGRLNNEHHSIVCVGYERPFVEQERIAQNIVISAGTTPIRGIYMIESSQMFQSYYVMDDNEIPYQKVQLSTKRLKSSKGILETKIQSSLRYSEGEHDIVSIILPLNKRMAMRADDAYTIFTQFLSGPCGLTNYLRSSNQTSCETLPGESSEKPLILRIFMATGKSLKHRRCMSFQDDLALLYSSIPMPRFVWVCEISSQELYKTNNILGEIVIDATSTKYDKDGSIILCLYPNILACRMPNEPYYPLMWKKLFENAIQFEAPGPFSSYWVGNNYSTKIQAD